MAAQARERLRSTVPVGYRWWAHVVPVATFVVLGLVVSLSQLERFGAWEAIAAAWIVIAILFGEWSSHRYAMHRRVFPRAVYRRHVVEHHAFFTHDDMKMDGYEDLHWVLFPPWALPLLVVSISPFFAALYGLGSPDLAWLFLLVVVAYYAIYEVVHLMTHVDAGEGGVGRAVAALGRHHRIHHDPALMRAWNFNFVVPLFDWAFGTRWSPSATRPPVPAPPDSRPLRR